MSNTLYINVVEFKGMVSGSTSFGYTASDSYGSDYCDMWGSMADFYQDVPDAEALKERVLSSEVFDSFNEGESGIIIEFPVNDDTNTMSIEALRELCEVNGVRIVQAEEEEIRGMWDWLDSEGNACDQSFDTEREAMVDAVLQLDLE